MTAADLERLLQTLSYNSRADLDVRMRELRKLRMLPVGGRGLYAPQIEPRHAATVLIALVGSAKAVEAGAAVLEFSPLVEHGGAQQTFAEALAEVVGDMEHANLVDRVVVNRTLVLARIHYQDRPERLFVPAGRDVGFNPHAMGTAGIYEAGVIGGGALHQIAIELTGLNDGEGEIVA